MSIEVIISTILGLGTLSLSLLSQAELWQRKEYRFDRIISYLKDASATLANRHLLLAGICMVGLGWILFLARADALASFIGWVALLCFLFDHGQRIRDKGVFRPKQTVKAVILLITAAFLVAIFFNFTFEPALLPALQWATIIFFAPFITALAVAPVNAVADIRKKQIIQKAKKIRAKSPGLKTVGITGSVGKTSTKHFLYHLLEDTDQNIVATKQHRNSEVPVAMDMIEQISPDTDVYIAEMGAYRTGEIKALTELTNPSIAVLTLIGNQHLSLFGSRENILQAKWELVDALPADGIAVLNADDPLLREKGENLDKKVIWFSAQKKTDVYADNIKMKSTSISFTLYINKHKKNIEASIVSKGSLLSLLAAAAAAKALDVSEKHIFKKAQTLTSYEKTMDIVKGRARATIIDDSYSSSENSIYNALDHLKIFSNPDKRIVFVPILELGGEAAAVHKKIGQELARANARVYIYGEDYKDALREGIGKNNKDNSIQWILDPLQLRELVTKDITDETVILLTGRLPMVIRQALLS